MDALVIINKPTGFSSNQILQQTKRLLGARKAGHTGSLDPLATGVLPICLGEATKLSEYLLASNKCYRVTACLGVTTETGDADGAVLERCHPQVVTDEVWQQVLIRFSGEQQQSPPIYSALKYQGKPLYYWARKGVAVPRKSRLIQIHQLSIEQYEHPFVSFQVACSKGTYIRSLVEDIGTFLGCGAHIVSLQRTVAGPYSLSQAVSIQDLRTYDKNVKSSSDFDWDQVLLPLSTALPGWPEVYLLDDQVDAVLQGQAVRLPQVGESAVASAPEQGLVKLLHAGSGFLGIGRLLEGGRVTPKRLFTHAVA